MLEVRSKLWNAFFVAVLLVVPTFFVAFGVAAANPDCLACWAGVVPTFWFMGIGAHQPILWIENTLSVRRRLTIWMSAMAAGVIAAIGIATMEIKLIEFGLYRSLILSDHGSSVFWLKGAINSAPVMLAAVVGGGLVRRSSRQGRVAPRSAGTRQSRTQDLETNMTVVVEDGPSEGRTPLRIPSKVVASIVLLLALGAVKVWLSEVAQVLSMGAASMITTVAYAAVLFYLWASAPLRSRMRGHVQRYLPRDWRLVPFYVAAILVSIAALRYILSD